MNFKFKINTVSILSLATLLAGLLLYISWGITYGVWADIGIYSIAIVLVLSGLFGLLLTMVSPSQE